MVCLGKYRCKGYCEFDFEINGEIKTFRGTYNVIQYKYFYGKTCESKADFTVTFDLEPFHESLKGQHASDVMRDCSLISCNCFCGLEAV